MSKWKWKHLFELTCYRHHGKRRLVVVKWKLYGQITLKAGKNYYHTRKKSQNEFSVLILNAPNLFLFWETLLLCSSKYICLTKKNAQGCHQLPRSDLLGRKTLVWKSLPMSQRLIITHFINKYLSENLIYTIPYKISDFLEELMWLSM